MMDKISSTISEIVRSNGGRLVGKVRLQKTIYLLDQIGLDSGVRYSYHHYGPYSDEVDLGIMVAKRRSQLREETGYRQSDGWAYSIFMADDDSQVGSNRPDVSGIHHGLKVMEEYNSTVLELAATAHWLAFVEKVPDWKKELKVRKTTKATDENVSNAMMLLRRLEIDLPS